MNEAQRKVEFFALMERFVQLGAMLNKSFDPSEAPNAATKLIISEMNKTHSRIEAMIEFEQALGS